MRFHVYRAAYLLGKAVGRRRAMKVAKKKAQKPDAWITAYTWNKKNKIEKVPVEQATPLFNQFFDDRPWWIKYPEESTKK